MFRGAKEGTTSHYNELQPIATSREGDSSISVVTYYSVPPLHRAMCLL